MFDINCYDVDIYIRVYVQDGILMNDFDIAVKINIK